ncbi:hypothetical protein CF319_g8418 [Tilletia indica]|nr:hypothetical protein CF319_g8418 [Tilletia indica]
MSSAENQTGAPATHSSPSLNPPHVAQQEVSPRTVLDAVQGLQDMMAIFSQRMDGFNQRIGGVELQMRGIPDNAPTTTSQLAPQSAPATTQVVSDSSAQALLQDQDLAATPAGITRRRARSTIPPHMQRSRTAPSTPQRTTPQVVQDFRSIPKPDKIVFRRVLEALGTNTRDFFDDVVEDDDNSISPASRRAQASGDQLGLTTSSIASAQDDDHISQRSKAASGQQQATPHGLPTPQQSPTTALQPLPSAYSARPLFCKQENFGEYSGKPEELEGFLSRVKDVLRSDTVNPGWEAAIVRALSLAMKGEAALWHQGLSNEEAARMDTVAGWEEQMREHFPVNIQKLRRAARSRKWEPTQETAIGYYFHKLLLLKQAYGYDQTDLSLVTDIKEELPPTFRQMLRLPREAPTLQDLRREISDWEPTWRELHNVWIRTTAAPAPILTRTTATTPRTAPVPSSTVRSAPVSTPPASGTTFTPTPAANQLVGLAATYDPSRITPAANGRPRTYRRPDTDAIMTLNRACGKCGQEHFNFEHAHLSAPQVRTMTTDDDDYPEQETGESAAEEEGSDHPSGF